MPDLEFDPHEPDAYYGWRVAIAEQAGADGATRHVVSCRYMLDRSNPASDVRPVVFPPVASAATARRLAMLLESVAQFMNTGGSSDVLKVVCEAMRGTIQQPGELVNILRDERDQVVNVYLEGDGNYTLVAPDYGVARATPRELQVWLAARHYDVARKAREAEERRQREDGTYVPFSWYYEEQSSGGGGNHVEGNAHLQSLPPPPP